MSFQAVTLATALMSWQTGTEGIWAADLLTVDPSGM